MKMHFRKDDKVILSGVNYYAMQKRLIKHKENKTIGTVIWTDFTTGEYVVDFDSVTFRIKSQYVAPAPGFVL